MKAYTESPAPLPLEKRSERNMGVELFRVVSMMMVVCLHLLGHGGILSSTAHLSVNYQLAVFLNVIMYCSVNCYALISGYANVKTEFRFRRFVYLWLETVFLITLTNAAVHWLIPSVEVKREWWIAGFFPLRKRELWYLCAYFFMYPLLPVLNKGLLSLQRWQHVCVMLLLQVPTLFRVLEHKDNYAMSSGYSAIWLICLYVIGAYFRIYGAPKWAKWFVTLPVFFLSALGVWLSKIIPEQQYKNGWIGKDSAAYEHRGELLSYLSPLIVIMSVMLLLFFMQVRIRGRVTKAVIANLGRATWGVFVLHVTSAFWYWSDFWDWFERFADYSAPKMLLCLLGATLVLYLALSAVSLARFYLFRLLRVHRGIDFLAELPKRCVQKKRAADRETETK